jgi:hypothetical protein
MNKIRRGFCKISEVLSRFNAELIKIVTIYQCEVLIFLTRYDHFGTNLVHGIFIHSGIIEWPVAHVERIHLPV